MASPGTKKRFRDKPPDEITVIGRRSGGGIGPGGLAALVSQRMSSAAQSGGRAVASAPAPRVNPTFPSPSPREIAAALSKKKQLADAALRQEMIDEIIVKGKRTGRFIGRFARFGGGLTFSADVLARIADQVSRQRLDEVGRIATRPVLAPPDTPVATIAPEVIPEIIVRAKRPTRRPPLPVAIPFRPIGGNPLITGNIVGFPSQRPTADPINLARPKAPPKKTPGVSIDPDQFVKFFSLPTSSPQSRSRRLRIGEPRTRLRDPISPDLTGGNLSGVALPQTSTRSQFCGPCPKPKRKKRRTKCWKKLVKEGRFESRDRTSNWNRIDCDTGKDLRTKR